MPVKINTQLKKDLNKYNIQLPFKSFDKRRNDYKEFIKNIGGIEKVINYFQEKLNEIPEYNKKVNIRTKQLVVQKKYNERKRVIRYIGNIDIVYEVEEDRDNPIAKSRGITNDEEYFKYKEHKKDTVYTLNVVIRFDELIAKRDIETVVKFKVERKRQQIFNSDNYIVSVNTVKYTYDINPFKKPTETQNIRLRDVVYNIEGYDNQDWNTNRGMCVIDYLKNLYGKCRGLIKVCTEENLIKLFGKTCVELGISSLDLYSKFAVPNNIAMYAYDDNDKCFLINKRNNRNVHHYPALMYKVSNNHLYPIPEDKRLSFVKTTSILNNDSELFNVITEKEEEAEKIPLDVVVMETKNPINEMVELMNKYKIIPQVDIKDGNVIGFKLNNVKYAVNQNIQLTKEITENMGMEYVGQTLGVLLKEIIGELPSSCLNPILKQELIIAKKNRTFCGLVDKDYKPLLLDENTRAYDINKCYSSVINNPLEDWILIDFNDDWEDWTDGDKIQLGLYQIYTSDTTFFRKSNIYSSAMLLKAKEYDIDFTIHKKLLCKKSANKNLFIPAIQKILKYSNTDPKKYKLMLNMLTGMLGKHKTTNTKCWINKSVEQIFNSLHYFKTLKTENVFVQKLPDTDYKLFGFETEKILFENNIPMYLQILDQANIKLYEMTKKLCGFGSKVIARKTDCAVIHHNNGKFPKIMINNEWGAYRECSIPSIDFVDEIDSVHYHSDLRKWIDHNIADSDDWKKIMNVCLERNGLLLNASAGRGKSFVAKQITNYLGKEKVIRLAPTNKAALNIKGMTIHKFLKMDNTHKINSKTVQALKRKNIQLIIIDEISMIGKELWKRLVLLKNEINIPFLLLGDDKQLPPVENEDIRDYFNHKAVQYLTNFHRNTLTVPKRFDERLEKYLNNVMNVNTELFPKRETVRNICYLNRTRKIVNKYWNEKLKLNNTHIFIEADKEDEYTQDIYIYKNLPIIARKTIEGGEYCVNNETFEVIDFDDENIYLYTTRPNEEGEEIIHSIDVKINEFSKLFCLNYCSTVHKSQGETISENFTIYDWNIMSKKCKYTALSRATNPENISFKNVNGEETNLEFRKNIMKKINSYKLYDEKTDIDVDYIIELFGKQNGECCLCNEMMKTENYKKNDSKQFSIDRIDSKFHHTKGNIQLICWYCNRSKRDRI